MIFDTLKYGTFTADDFINAHTTNDFSKFTQLPIDLRKKFISDVIDKHPNQESNNFKQAAFDFIDGEITGDQFRESWWKCWPPAVAATAAAAVVWRAVAVAVAVAAGAAGSLQVVAEYYRPQLEKHASHLNKLIGE